MAVPKPAVKFTYEDYRHTSDDERYELLDGELIMVPAPLLIHQSIQTKLGWRLAQFVESRGLGRVFFAPCDVMLSDTNVVQPDLLFVSKGRERILTPENVQGAPDLVVEILSRSSASRDRTLKRALYARYGVREYWLVDPGARTVTVLALGEGDFETLGTYGEGQVFTSPTLEGFSVNLDEIFQ